MAQISVVGQRIGLDIGIQLTLGALPGVFRLTITQANSLKLHTID